MRIKFTGYVDFKETPDDRGSVDHWLVDTLHEACAEGKTTDDAFEDLHLSWENSDARNTNS